MNVREWVSEKDLMGMSADLYSDDVCSPWGFCKTLGFYIWGSHKMSLQTTAASKTKHSQAHLWLSLSLHNQKPASL